MSMATRYSGADGAVVGADDVTSGAVVAGGVVTSGAVVVGAVGVDDVTGGDEVGVDDVTGASVTDGIEVGGVVTGVEVIERLYEDKLLMSSAATRMKYVPASSTPLGWPI